MDNTLAEMACKLKHQTKKSGRASHKENWVGYAIPKKWHFYDITNFEMGFGIADTLQKTQVLIFIVRVLVNSTVF